MISCIKNILNFRPQPPQLLLNSAMVALVSQIIQTTTKQCTVVSSSVVSSSIKKLQTIAILHIKDGKLWHG